MDLGPTEWWVGVALLTASGHNLVCIRHQRGAPGLRLSMLLREYWSMIHFGLDALGSSALHVIHMSGLLM